MNNALTFGMVIAMSFLPAFGMELNPSKPESSRSKTPTYITAYLADGTRHGIRSLDYTPSLITMSDQSDTDYRSSSITANEDVFSFILHDLAVRSDQAVFDQLQEFYQRIGYNQLDFKSLEHAIMLAHGDMFPSDVVSPESSSPRTIKRNSLQGSFQGAEGVIKIGELEVRRNKEFMVQFPQSGNFAVLSSESFSNNPVYLQIALSALRSMLKPQEIAPKRYCIDLRSFQQEYIRYKHQNK